MLNKYVSIILQWAQFILKKIQTSIILCFSIEVETFNFINKKQVPGVRTVAKAV